MHANCAGTGLRTTTGRPAARIYWESYTGRITGPVPVPAGCSIFPKDIYRPSRRMAEPLFPDLRYWNEPDKGGHFAALEQPATFVSEVRAAFRAFRLSGGTDQWWNSRRPVRMRLMPYSAQASAISSERTDPPGSAT